MKNTEFYKKLFAIAVPITLQQLIISSLNLIDTFMISSLTKEAIAGVGAANKVFFLLNLFLFGMSSGSSILTAQFWGKKDVENIKKVYGLSLTFALGGGLLFTIVAILLPQQVMSIFSTDAQVIIEGANYLRIVGFSYLFTAVTFSTMFVLRSTNYVKLPLFVTMVAISVNTFLNWVLIYGNMGFQPMGVEGAATATLIARTLECFMLVGLSNYYKLPPSGKLKTLFSYNKNLAKHFSKIAMPVVINEILWSTGVTMYAVVYGRMGTDAMAAMTITQTIEQIIFVVSVGVGNASAVMLGNSLGAMEGEKIYDEAVQFVKINFLLGAFMGIIIILSAPHIAGIYSVPPIVKYNIIGSLSVFGMYTMVKSVNLVIIVGILRSGGDTIFAAALDGIAVWGLGVPLAILTGLVLKWDLPYVYAAILFEEMAKFSFGIKRMKSKRWMNNLVEH
ncbi:MATE family efflux transporter [Vallitaleaceae bacterium 9-2]